MDYPNSYEENLQHSTSENHFDCGEDDLQTTLFKRSCELFNACDVEKKGYLSKQDMPRLEQKLGLDLPPDQLNLVFDTLDKDGDGFLTLEEFAEGFGSYLGVTSTNALDDHAAEYSELGADNHHYDLDLVTHTKDDLVTYEEKEVNPGSHVTMNERIYTNDHGMNARDDEEHFQNLVQQIGATGVLEDLDGMKMLWGQLKQGPPELLANFEEFLQRVTGEIKKTHREYKSLETILQSKSLSHDEEVKRLYEEMETQIMAEKERVKAEERVRERQLKEEMEAELRDKDRQLQELLNNHMQMVAKMKELNSQEAESKQEKERLQKQKDDLEEVLMDSRRNLEESRSYINQLRNQQKEEKKERALAALQVSEGIALERESLVKQLDLLKDMNRRLRDDRDEEELRRSCGSLQELNGGEGRGGLPRASSVQTSGYQRGGMSAQNSFSSLQGPGGGLRAAASMDGRAGPIESQASFVQQDLMFRRSQFLKQGSVLSNYINTDPTWNMPTYESDVDVEECDAEYDDVSLPDLSRSSPRPRRPMPPRSPRPNNGDDDDDVGVCCSGEESEEEQVDARRYKSSRKPKRQGATDVEDKYGGRREPVGANSSPECGDRLTRTASEIESAPPERVFKVVFVGDSAVGKSSFIHRFCNNTFRIAFQATIGVDFQVKNLWVDHHIIALQLWDTAGQERFRSITKQYFRKADGVILMYDITNETTFKNVRNWMASVQEGTEDGTVLVLAGNKLDLIEENEKNRVVATSDGMRLADEFGSLFFETSAKSGAHIPETIEAMARLLREREDKEMEKALRLSEAEARKKTCCKK